MTLNHPRSTDVGRMEPKFSKPTSPLIAKVEWNRSSRSLAVEGQFRRGACQEKGRVLSLFQLGSSNSNILIARVYINSWVFDKLGKIMHFALLPAAAIRFIVDRNSYDHRMMVALRPISGKSPQPI